MFKRFSLGSLRFLYRFGISPTLDTLAWARRSWLATLGLALSVMLGGAYLALLLMAHNACAGWAEPTRVAEAPPEPQPAVKPVATPTARAASDPLARRRPRPAAMQPPVGTVEQRTLPLAN